MKEYSLSDIKDLYNENSCKRTLEQRVTRLERLVYESKQVGTLYHSAALTTALNFIISGDTLQASGRYRANKISNTNDVVYFSRNRSIEKIKFLTGSDVIVTLVVDGDKLSERYKVFPYNDFGFGQETDLRGNVSIDDSPEVRQQEECVRGPIKNISNYITEIIVRFNDNAGNTQWWTEKSLSDEDLSVLIDKLGEYCNKHHIKLTGDKIIVDRIKGKMSVAKKFAYQNDDYREYEPSDQHGEKESKKSLSGIKINVNHDGDTNTFYFICKNKATLIAERSSIKNLVYSLIDFDGDEDIVESLLYTCDDKKIILVTESKDFDFDYFLEYIEDLGLSNKILGNRVNGNTFINRSNKKYHLDLISTINVTVDNNDE